MSLQTSKMTNWRWWICGLLFVATTVNYLDRQVLSLLAPDYIMKEFHWTSSDYGIITGVFSILYAFCMLFAGKFVDWMGTKKGYLWAIGVWSFGACLHALCGIGTATWVGLTTEQLKVMSDVDAVALGVPTIGVIMFLICRAILGLGEAGNFPAAIKVTAEFFPKKDRSYATSIFNAGASVGALASPLLIPWLAEVCGGWEPAFIIIGALGFIWMGFFVKWYDKPERSSHVNEAELIYINQDEEAEAVAKEEEKDEKTIPFAKCFAYKQTWAFVVGKFFTDGVWWFFLFWAPKYFADEYQSGPATTEGKWLLTLIYAIVTILSIYICKLPTYFMVNRGMNAYAGRMLSMLMFAFLPLLCILAQPMGAFSPWWAAIIIGLVGAGHQAWSANLFSTIGDMFPKSTIATITGIGGMAGGIGSALINYGSGLLFDYSEKMASAFQFLGFDGKPAGYMIVFCICAVAYLLAWVIMKTLVPKYKPIILN